MGESLADRFARWQLQDTLLRYPGLRIAPSVGEGLGSPGIFTSERPAPTGLRSRTLTRSTCACRRTSRGARLRPGKPADGSIRRFTSWKGICSASARGRNYVSRSCSRQRCSRSSSGSSSRICSGTPISRSTSGMPFDELEHGNAGLLQHFAKLFGGAGSGVRTGVRSGRVAPPPRRQQAPLPVRGPTAARKVPQPTGEPRPGAARAILVRARSRAPSVTTSEGAAGGSLGLPRRSRHGTAPQSARNRTAVKPPVTGPSPEPLSLSTEAAIPDLETLVGFPATYVPEGLGR